MLVRPELPRQLSTLMVCRAIILTLLLGSGVLIGHLLSQPLVGSDSFFLLTGAGYALTVIYSLLHPVWSRLRLAAWIQVAGDIALITGFVEVTGGVDSPFSLLYFLPVIAASIMLGRAGSMLAAAGAWCAWALLVILALHGWAPAQSAGGSQQVLPVDGTTVLDKRVAYSLFTHFLGFFSVSVLASYLTGKLSAAGAELAENREALAHVQALNKNIVDSITSGIITTDLAGLITFMNRGAEEITGGRLEELMGTPVESFLRKQEGFLVQVRGNLDRERRYRFEGELTRADGAAICLGFTSVILKDQRSEAMGYVFSFQDLTEIRALEQEVQLKEHMAALGEMAAGIAHEIRNPLASMSGSAQMLRGSLSPGGEEAELLDIVVRESRRLDGIIRDFLLFARPGPPSPRPADLVPIIRDSLTLLRNSEEVGARHEIVLSGDEAPVPALVDENKIKQVFWNLAKNALKAMPQGGRLRVSLRREADAALVSFADDGMGMNPAQAAKAFEPFQTSFSEGTGLGLSVVYRIVQEHGGRIRVRSREGAGTEVVVQLPAAAGMRLAAWAGIAS